VAVTRFSAPTPDSPAFNQLAGTLGDCDALKLIDCMLEALPETFRELQAAAACDDLERVEMLASRLRSDSVYVGSAELTERLRKLEWQARSGASMHLSLEVVALKAPFAWVIKALHGSRNVCASRSQLPG
jgi:hypothetical protein